MKRGRNPEKQPTYAQFIRFIQGLLSEHSHRYKGLSVIVLNMLNQGTVASVADDHPSEV